MAIFDYRLCDVCGIKTFYDANIDYVEFETDGPVVMYDLKVDGKTEEVACPLHVGGWAVLCKGCIETHDVEIVKRRQEVKQ